jgi:hypothetical protein
VNYDSQETSIHNTEMWLMSKTGILHWYKHGFNRVSLIAARLNVAYRRNATVSKRSTAELFWPQRLVSASLGRWECIILQDTGRTVSYPLTTIDLIIMSTPYSLLTTTTMGEHQVKTQGDKRESQATTATGVENAANNVCRTSSRLANERTTQAGQIGTNVGDIVSSRLMPIISVDGSEPESITSDGDGKPPPVATEKMVPFDMVVRLLCLSCKSIQRYSVSLVLCCPSFPFACITGAKQRGLGGYSWNG